MTSRRTVPGSSPVSTPASSTGLPPSPVHWAAVEDWVDENPRAASARQRSRTDDSRSGPEILPVPTRTQCSALALFATAIGAEDILMLGSTAGVSEAWLLDAMADGGTLTVIDPDHHRQALTRDALADVPSGSVRVITAQAAEVLPRLTDSGYDLLILDERAAVSGDAEQAPRLLRAGGVLAVRLTDHEGSRAVRDMAASVREDPRWTTSWLTVGDGLLVAVWQGPTDAAASQPIDSAGT